MTGSPDGRERQRPDVVEWVARPRPDQDKCGAAGTLLRLRQGPRGEGQRRTNAGIPRVAGHSVGGVRVGLRKQGSPRRDGHTPRPWPCSRLCTGSEHVS